MPLAGQAAQAALQCPPQFIVRTESARTRRKGIEDLVPGGGARTLIEGQLQRRGEIPGVLQQPPQGDGHRAVEILFLPGSGLGLAFRLPDDGRKPPCQVPSGAFM